MKTAQQSRIRIQTTDSVPLQPFIAKKNKPQKKHKKQRKSLNERILNKLPKRKPVAKKTISKHVSSSKLKEYRDNVLMVLAGTATFLILGAVLSALWVYAGPVYSFFAVVTLAVVGAIYWVARTYIRTLTGLKAEQSNIIHNYEKVTQEKAQYDTYASAAKHVQPNPAKTPESGKGSEEMEPILQELKKQIMGGELVEQNNKPIIPSLARQEQGDDRFADWTDEKISRCVSQALEQDRIDLFIQPIVNLPQRKRRFYEMYSRIRIRPDVYLPASKYINLAEDQDLLTHVDNALLLHALKLIHAATAGDLDRSFFCNISSATLHDQQFMADLLTFLTQYRLLAPRLVFELSQNDISNVDEDILSILNSLSRLGCRFSMDRVTDLQLDSEHLHQCHIRYVKVSAKNMVRILDEKGGFSRLRRMKDELEYNGIDLIVEKIESEKQLLELLDVDIDYGQGYLFGEPRKWAEDRTAVSA